MSVKTKPVTEPSYEQLKALIDFSLDVICTIDKRGNFVYLSKAVTDVWGYYPDELIGRSCMDFIIEEDRDRSIHINNFIFNGQKLTDFENSYRHKNGHIVPMIWSAQWDFNQEVMYCVGKNATALKTTERELRKADEKRIQTRQMFELFMNNSPIPGWVTDKKGMVHYMNPACLGAFGIEYYLGKSMYDLFGNQAKQYTENNVKVIQENTGLETIEQSCNAAGDSLIFKVIKFPIDHKGERMCAGWAIEISKEYHLQKEIEEQLERYNKVIEATSDAIYDFDFVNGEVVVGSKYKELFGYDDVTLTLEQVFSRVHPDDLPGLQATMAATFATKEGNRFQMEYRTRHIDGHYVNIINKVYAIRNEKGEIIRGIGAIQDVSKQKQLQEQLEKQVQLYDTVIEATSEVIWDFDIINNTICMGDKFKDIFGYDDKFISLEDVINHIHEEDRERFSQLVQASFADANCNKWEDEYRYLHAEGHYIHVVNRAHFIRENGIPVRAIGAIQDITERFQLQKELEKQVKRYDLVIEATSDIIWDFDIRGNDVFLGNKFKEVFGYDNDRLTMEEVIERVHPDDRERVAMSITTALEDEHCSFWKEEYRLKCANGEYIDLVNRGYILRYRGKPIRTIGASQNITEQKKLFTDLVALNKNKERLVSIIAHDLRSPVAGCASLLNILIDDFETCSKEDVQTYLDLIRNNTHETLNLLDELLSWAQSQMNKVTYTPKVIKVDNEIEKAIATLSKQIDEKGIHIDIRLTDLDELTTDLNMFRCIIRNLVSNAIKFSPPQSIISIVGKRTAKGALFSVVDKGVGMGEEVRNKLLKGLNSKSTYGTNGEKGIGIGLSLIRDFIKQCEGQLFIESQQGQGSTFSFLLPL